MSEGGVQGGQLPPHILADQKAPPGSGGTPHYYLTPRIFDPCCIPAKYKLYILKNLLHTILLDLVKSICKYNQVTERINRGSVLHYIFTTLPLQHIYIPTFRNSEIVRIAEPTEPKPSPHPTVC